MIKTSRSLYALIAALITCSAVYAAPPKSAFVRIITMENSATIRDGFSQNTSLEALQRVILYPRVTGRLQKLMVSKGSLVKTGQQVAVLAHDEQNAQVNAAKAAVERTRASFSVISALKRKASALSSFLTAKTLPTAVLKPNTMQLVQI